MKKFAELKTPFEDNIGDIPFSDYPRPQLVRDSYINLNGEWHFSVNDWESMNKITVPFPPESRISGIHGSFKKNDVLTYVREFTLERDFIKDKVLLHFGAVDQHCFVYVNDCDVGHHSGGYLPFSFDITRAVNEGTNSIRVVVTDPLDNNYPYGKQRKKRGGMWYTPISGIWQTVWLESVPENYIEALRITPTLDSVTVEVKGGALQKTLVFNGREYDFSGDSVCITVKDAVNWTPDHPHLYYFSLRSGDDTVSSYFALRTVTTDGKYILLNNKPYFFHGLLDQGYFSDGIYTPATPDGYKNDILKMKECGFNMLRKHIKVEPDLFYYYCDVYGMAVFQDFVNSGGYNFIIDTALPTAFLRRGITHTVSKRRREVFFETSCGTVDMLYNHPSVVYYTIFNEGWGQFEADKCYKYFKNYDPTRIYDTTSGWFKTAQSDVESDHIYFKSVNLSPVKGRPMVLSEFGGYSCRVGGHHYNLDKNTGYSFFTTDCKQFEAALIELYRRDILFNIKNGLCASVLTQLSDVEDETNGLMTYDRQVLKVSPQKMCALAQEIFEEFEKNRNINTPK